MSGHKPFILASQSKARQALLRGAQIDFEAIPADVDERDIQNKSGLRIPGVIAERLACEKALYVARKYPGRIVIGADQTLALGERMFNKPAGRAAAADQLRALAGRTHDLNSAVAVARDGDIIFSHIAIASMTMRALDEKAISQYLARAGDSVTQSVGSYQLEGLGVHLFERIEGDYFTILGLPLLPLLTFLRDAKLIAF